MNSNDFNPGDILIASDTDLVKGYHPIIYIEGNSDINFVGAMITHCEDKNKNIKMDSTLFFKPKGYENTHLVIGKFIKPEKWGPFRKVNELTAEGLEFTIHEIQNQPLEAFSNYFRRNKE